MDAEDIAEIASHFSRRKIDAEGRKAAVMIETDLDHEECAVALAAALIEHEYLRDRIKLAEEGQAKIIAERNHWFKLVPHAEAVKNPFRELQ
jgi:hypothetical protein